MYIHTYIHIYVYTYIHGSQTLLLRCPLFDAAHDDWVNKLTNCSTYFNSFSSILSYFKH